VKGKGWCIGKERLSERDKEEKIKAIRPPEGKKELEREKMNLIPD